MNKSKINVKKLIAIVLMATVALSSCSGGNSGNSGGNSGSSGGNSGSSGGNTGTTAVSTQSSKNQSGSPVYIDDESGGVSPPVKDNSITVDLLIDYKPNLLLAKYDIRILIDDYLLDTLSNSNEAGYYFTSAPGTYTFRAENVNDSSIYGEAIFRMTEDGETHSFSIKTHQNYIEVATR